MGMAKKVTKVDMSNQANFYKYANPKGDKVSYQVDILNLKPITVHRTVGGKNLKPTNLDFYRDMVALVNNPPEASRELKAYSRQMAKKTDMGQGWNARHMVPSHWTKEQAEHQAYFDALQAIASKHGLSLNQVNKKMTAFAYAAAGERKRLPKELATEIYDIGLEISRNIPKAEARYASANYFANLPYVDMVRFNRRMQAKDRETIGMQERIAQRAEREIRGRIGEGKLPPKAAQGWLEQAPVISGVYSDIEKFAKPEERQLALREGTLMIFRAQQGGMQGRIARRRAGKWLDLTTKKIKGKEGQAHSPIFMKKLMEVLDVPVDERSYKWTITKINRYRWKDKHRGMGADWKESPEYELVLEKIAEKNKGKDVEKMEETEKLATLAGRHYKAKSQIYQTVLDPEERFRLLTNKKKIRKF
jgi:hypothetical protein